MVASGRQRILWVYTDDLDYVKYTYKEKFRKLKNVDNLTYEQLHESTIIEKDNGGGDEITTVVIIHDFDKLSHAMLIDLINLTKSGKIDLIYTNDIDQFNQCYRSMTASDTIKHPVSDDNLISEIQKHFRTKNINVAIISDDARFMSHIITDLIENVDNRGSIDGATDYYDTKTCLGLDSKMPELIQQWVYNVWYGKKSNLSSNNLIKPAIDIIDARVYKVISVNVNNERLITYYFINPYKNANLSECIDCFDVLLVDMQTHFSTLNFGKDIGNLNIIPFIKSPIENIYNTSIILNIINNMITYSRGNYRSGHTGSIYNGYHPHDISRSIKVTEEGISIDNISLLKSISPFETKDNQ